MPQLIQNGNKWLLVPPPRQNGMPSFRVSKLALAFPHTTVRDGRAGTCHLHEPCNLQRLMNSWTNPIERFAPRRSR